ncbi:unnamed protein product [Heligmosomoides polygyrus]|uniref:Transposase n=1 Tax=Heligmosomoides polygyrus TaxID=6339 RepID=A0A183FCE5_HELPZ|nr:unnamed protein product [Heligmosomoides polygyrus]
MTAASFTAAETCRNGGVAKELAMTLDNGTDFPFTTIYEPLPAEASLAVSPYHVVFPLDLELFRSIALCRVIAVRGLLVQ